MRVARTLCCMHVQDKISRGKLGVLKTKMQIQFQMLEGPSRPLDPLRKMRLYRPPTSPGRLLWQPYFFYNINILVKLKTLIIYE
jgi:hypothetical protein